MCDSCSSACLQVVSAADELRDALSGAALVRTAYVNPRDGPPLEPPDIIVSTPAGLIGTVDTWSESAGWEWTSTGLANRCTFSAYAMCSWCFVVVVV